MATKESEYLKNRYGITKELFRDMLLNKFKENGVNLNKLKIRLCLYSIHITYTLENDTTRTINIDFRELENSSFDELGKKYANYIEKGEFKEIMKENEKETYKREQNYHENTNTNEEVNNIERKLNTYKLTYDWNAPLLAGSVVCAVYYDFDGIKQVGMFVVLYDEQLDAQCLGRMNVLALKLSTQSTLTAIYSCNISQTANPFLNRPCIACCSKLHTLHKSKEIYKIIGQIDEHTYNRIVKTYARFSRDVQRQMLDRI